MPDSIHSQDDKEDLDIPMRPSSVSLRTLVLPPEEPDDESELSVPSEAWH